jgi:hypothetical protein
MTPAMQEFVQSLRETIARRKADDEDNEWLDPITFRMMPGSAHELLDALESAQAELAATKTELAHVVQVSGVLCEKCGWAMKFPDEPCRCELEAELAAVRGGVVVIPERQTREEEK